MINLTESQQAQMAKEMKARLSDIEKATHDDLTREIIKIESMLTTWLIRMGESND